VKLTLSVDVRDDRVVAELVGEHLTALSADRIADLVRDAVRAALDDTDRAEHDQAPADEPAEDEQPQTRPVDLADPDAVQREALRRLENGEHLEVVAQQLGVAPATVRRWDRDPSPGGQDRSATDWAAVDAVLSGRLRADQVSIRDRRAAVRELTERGMTADQIAARTGMSMRTVVRHRSAAS
jgi:hypothetical protein